MNDKEKSRILKFLAAGSAAIFEGAMEGRLLLESSDRGAIGATRICVEELAKAGLCSRSGDRIALTEAGDAHRRRLMAASEPFATQHRTLEDREIETAAGREHVVINLEESPLRAIAQRRDRGGRRFLTGAEVEAGERLRADYTRGQMMPRLGANWQASVASGRRDGGSGGVADLPDAALGARMRVEKAVRAVGPELAGVLIDVCCYLKGLEVVEQERGWPVRSAKIVLKAALGALCRHYEPPSRRERGPARAILHWGAEGYRPSL